MSDHRFPRDAPLSQVLSALENLGFHVVRRGNHITLARSNADGTTTPMTIPNHRQLKASTLRTILSQAGIDRDTLILEYDKG